MPSWDDILGTSQHRDRLPTSAPLHVKHVSRISIDALRFINAATKHSLSAFDAVSGWLDNDAFYNDVPTRSAEHIPQTRLSKADIAKLLEHNVIAKVDPTEVRGPIKLFKVAELSKNRWRPIRHTFLINDCLGKNTLPPCPMATKRDIVKMVHAGNFFVALDFAAYYDQFTLSEDVSRRMCFRKGDDYFRITTLAMGQRQAVPVAALATALLLDIPMRRTTTNAVIDNVIFVGSRDAVAHDAQAFVDRVARCNGQLNEDTSNVASLVKTSGDWCGVRLDFWYKTVALTDKIVEKVEVSWGRRDIWTYRGFAAHTGLLFYSWGILEAPMAEFFPLLRFISHCGRLLQERPDLWDSPAHIWPSAMPSLASWTAIALANKPRYVRAPADPEWLVCTDASRWGWGYVAVDTATGELRSHGAAWNAQQKTMYGEKLGKSTVAEPLAIVCAMCHLLTRGSPKRVKVGTDNTVAEASYNRGFNSHSYDINECLGRLQKYFGPEFVFEFKHIPGAQNIADPLSRGQQLAQGDWATAQSLRRLVG